LTTFAVYESTDRLANAESNIHRVILAELQCQLSAEGFEAQVVIDSHVGEEQSKPCAQLLQLSQKHHVGATIALSTTHHSLPWITQLPHFACFSDHPKVAGPVSLDYSTLASICITSLVEQGCKSVAVISGLSKEGLSSLEKRTSHTGFYQTLYAIAKDHGIKVHDEWKDFPVTQPGVQSISSQQHGYNLFHEIWQKPNRPDGLIVYPDSLMPGILLAVAELNVRVPEDLALAYHRNMQTTIFNPYPATEAVLIEREIAEALIAQAKRLWSGEKCDIIRVKFHLNDNV
jgi:DNA-binding LacI/PurR family transcriptional regulator